MTHADTGVEFPRLQLKHDLMRSSTLRGPDPRPPPGARRTRFRRVPPAPGPWPVHRSARTPGSSGAGGMAGTPDRHRPARGPALDSAGKATSQARLVLRGARKDIGRAIRALEHHEWQAGPRADDQAPAHRGDTVRASARPVIHHAARGAAGHVGMRECRKRRSYRYRGPLIGTAYVRRWLGRCHMAPHGRLELDPPLFAGSP
jgi:hypothetical protein